MIKIQKENFDIEKEIILIKSRHNNIGAVSTFVGFVTFFAIHFTRSVRLGLNTHFKHVYTHKHKHKKT